MIRTLSILIITLLMHCAAMAQYTSAGGKFEVDEVKGCAPFTITVTPSPMFPCDNNNPCAAFYEDDVTNEPLITPPFTHTYTQPGNYTLKILRGTLYDSISIEVFPNITPQFDVYSCGNYEVSVQINDSNYDEYIVDYNDGSPIVRLPPMGSARHNFGTSATQTVTVRGQNTNSADNCNQGGVIVNPLQTLPAPQITLLEVLDNATIRLVFNAQPNVQYKLGISTNNGTNFQQVKTIFNVNADTIRNLRVDDNYYCFQLAAFDPCNNTVANSPVICSANLDIAVRNKAIDVTWATLTSGVSGYTLNRTSSDGATLIANPPSSPYADLGIVCGVDYCYRLTTNYPNGSRSISLQKCGSGFSDDIPTAITNVTALVTDNSVALDWQSDPAFIPFEYTVSKSIDGTYLDIATTAQASYTDTEYSVEGSICYRIAYTDVCGNQSPPGIETCPIRLSAALLNDNSVSVSWTAYQGWTNGVASYTIEKYNAAGALLQTIPVGTATSFTDDSGDINNQEYIYVVKANAAEPGLGQAVSNRVLILKDPNLFHPTAFTPNGDNLNDNFTVFGQYVVDFEMKIFNRWGELLFTTSDISSGWDGTYKGREMPEGTYTFIANITDRAGRIFKRSGSVLLLRRY